MLRAEAHAAVPGGTWEQVWRNRVPGQLLGVPAAFASIGDRIAIKEASGRKTKDLPDARRLRRLRQRRERGA